MIRALWFIAKLAIVIAIAVWFIEHPGDLRIDWLGFVVETTVFLATVALLAAIGVAIVLYRVVRAILGAPGRWGRWSGRRHREAGLRALARGWTAVAAGDAPAARRYAAEAERHLRDPELTQLLSAQTAQLSGDERSAEQHFRSMAERPETAFLGVRGLLNRAVQEGDRDEALRLARRAHDLRPRTPWVLTTLFDLEARAGNWERAQQILGEAERAGAIPEMEARRHRAAVLLERSFEAELDGKAAEALTHAGRAFDLQPAFAPAAARVARLLARNGKHKQAMRAVERAWKLEPHPELAEAAREAAPDQDPLAAVKRFERLLSLSPDRHEAHVALAEASLRARLWGEARNHLAKALAIRPSARVYRLLAELAESEHGDTAGARDWLDKAATAPRDAHWACERCRAPAPGWRGICPSCGSFDSLEWRRPPEPTGALVPVAPDAEGPLAVTVVDAPEPEAAQPEVPPGDGRKQDAA
jgi:HemY protein